MQVWHGLGVENAELKQGKIFKSVRHSCVKFDKIEFILLLIYLSSHKQPTFFYCVKINDHVSVKICLPVCHLYKCTPIYLAYIITANIHETGQYRPS